MSLLISDKADENEKADHKTRERQIEDAPHAVVMAIAVGTQEHLNQLSRWPVSRDANIDSLVDDASNAFALRNGGTTSTATHSRRLLWNRSPHAPNNCSEGSVVGRLFFGDIGPLFGEAECAADDRSAGVGDVAGDDAGGGDALGRV